MATLSEHQAISRGVKYHRYRTAEHEARRILERQGFSAVVRVIDPAVPASMVAWSGTGGVHVFRVVSTRRAIANASEAATLFREEIEQLRASSRLDLCVVYVLERPPADWDGERGFVTADILRRHLSNFEPPSAFEVFICGPQPMMDAVERALLGLGVDVGDIHTERFDLV